MTKSLNQQIFEILNEKFPGEFKAGDCKYSGESTFGTEINEAGDLLNGNQCGEFLHDAFWLAEKVGLFILAEDKIGKGSLTTFNGQWCLDLIHINCSTQFWLADSIPEVICKAVIEIYGRKEK